MQVAVLRRSSAKSCILLKAAVSLDCPRETAPRGERNSGVIEHPKKTPKLTPHSPPDQPGRHCAPNPVDTIGNASYCCIPCPLFDYVYSNNFKRGADGAAWVHVVGLVLTTFLLISYLVLPVQATRRAYLNIVLLVGIMLLSLGFVIPLAKQPEQCFDPVTPNGQSSSLTCAFGGAFVAFGGVFLVTWVLIRALFMHLQICWDWLPGKISYMAANAIALAVTMALVAATLADAGVSFRFGGYCHVSVGSLATYWAWLLGFGGLACILQLATFAYCIKIYLTTNFNAKKADSSQQGAESLTGSSTSRAARATARRVYQALSLQWRSLTIVAVAIATTTMVCCVFIVYNEQRTMQVLANGRRDGTPWIICLIRTQDKEKCLDLTGPIVMPEALTVATLFVLAFVGVEAFLLLCRWDMLKAWWALIRRPRRTEKS
jgi:hypothetical protein